MAAQISPLPFFLGALLISSFPAISSSTRFTDENHLRLVSDDSQHDIVAPAFSIMEDNLDDHSVASLFSPHIKAIYQFGDSIADTGNYICDNPSSTTAKLPYGETYFHKATGRCSNGLLMIDYFARHLNLPFLDAYLNKRGNFTHGVNFAVMGATALNASTLAAKHIISTVTDRSLSVQLDCFKSHLRSICSKPSDCKMKLSKALFLMGEIGGNDFNFAFLQGNPMSVAYDLVPEVVQAIKRAVEEVIDLGATRIGVPGNFPVGCMSVYLATFKTKNLSMYDELKCLKNLNGFAKFSNNKLQQAVRELQKDHPGVVIVYMDYFTAFRKLLRHAKSLGFDETAVHKTCCGIGDMDYNFDASRTCGNDGVPACENPQTRVNWDGYHLTQHAYHVMAKWLMRNSLYDISHVA